MSIQGAFKARTIYCDESGYSGNNLLDASQPFFTFATLGIEPLQAQTLVEKVTKDFGLTGGELKAQRLLRFHRGQKAVAFLIRETAPIALLSAWHKKYSLASKFFEYIFEPLIADNNKLFYDIGFHRFVSNVIYHEAIKPSTNIGATLEAFQAAMRRRSGDGIQELFPVSLAPSEHSEAMREIESFTVMQEKAISKQMADLSDDDPVYRWLLDLSVSALAALLTSWSTRAESLRVICDDSKPLHQHREHFDMLVGRPDLVGPNRPMIVLEGREVPVGFNLAEPITFVSSADYPGVQLADVLASTLAYVLGHGDQAWSRECLTLLSPAISDYSVFPEEEVVDLRSRSGIVNRLVLRELVSRSAKGLDLLDGMPRFVQAAFEYHKRLVSGTLSSGHIILP